MKKGWLFGSVFCGINALIMIFSGVTGFLNSDSKKDLNKEIVVLKEAKILPENEGKMVIISGVPQWKGVEDKVFNVKTDTFFLRRKVEYLDESSRTVKDSKGNEEKVYQYMWKELKGQKQNDILFNTPTNERVDTEEFLGDVTLGEFKLDDTFKKRLSGFGVMDKVEPLDSNVAQSKGMWVIRQYPSTMSSDNNPVSFREIQFGGKTLSLQYIASLFEGGSVNNWDKPYYAWKNQLNSIGRVEFLRVSFDYYVMNKIKDSGITIIAHQKDGKLTFDKNREKEGDISEIALGNIPLDEMVKKYVTGKKTGGAGVAIIGVFFGLLAAFLFKKAKI